MDLLKTVPDKDFYSVCGRERGFERGDNRQISYVNTFGKRPVSYIYTYKHMYVHECICVCIMTFICTISYLHTCM